MGSTLQLGSQPFLRWILLTRGTTGWWFQVFQVIPKICFKQGSSLIGMDKRWQKEYVIICHNFKPPTRLAMHEFNAVKLKKLLAATCSKKETAKPKKRCIHLWYLSRRSKSKVKQPSNNQRGSLHTFRIQCRGWEVLSDSPPNSGQVGSPWLENLRVSGRWANHQEQIC